MTLVFLSDDKFKLITSECKIFYFFWKSKLFWFLVDPRLVGLILSGFFWLDGNIIYWGLIGTNVILLNYWI